jgi:NADH-quinone oxidoreductase subunit L
VYRSAWLIPLLPLVSFALIVFFLRFRERLAALWATLSVGAGLAISIVIAVEMFTIPSPDLSVPHTEAAVEQASPVQHHGTVEERASTSVVVHEETTEHGAVAEGEHGDEHAAKHWVYDVSFDWAPLPGIAIPMGLLIDPLTVVMLIVVGVVSFLVHVYSFGYMKGDPRFARFFAYLSFFTFAMSFLVLANNYFQIFIGWELVGLASYLLIGFWFEKPEAAAAGKKAFITTRVGDLGFIAGILILVVGTGTFHFAGVFEGVAAGKVAGGLLAAAAVLTFMGAIGKSAQFPLHVWLPDAMEGPTPVSALIHAATMVAAGVYLVARTLSVFLGTETGLLIVTAIGSITALIAATIALVHDDIKRVLAYSTISQLGYMILALGCGGYTAGTFHLFTHAFFKALLFLCAGSVIHAVHSNDIFQMGGLSKKMKVTAWTFIVAALSISGIFPLSGFWSKDEIIGVALGNGPWWAFAVAIAVAGMTSFYMFRLVFLTFFGKPRNTERFEHAHESPKSMTIPLVILAVLSVCAGWIGIPGIGVYGEWVSHAGGVHLPFSVPLALISTVVVGGGILLAYLMYIRGTVPVTFLSARVPHVYLFLRNKWYFDELYDAILIRPLLRFSDLALRFDLRIIDGAVNGAGWLGLFIADVKIWFDLHVVDGLVNLSGRSSMSFGRFVRKAQTGRVQNYALVILVAVVLGVWAFVL